MLPHSEPQFQPRIRKPRSRFATYIGVLTAVMFLALTVHILLLTEYHYQNKKDVHNRIVEQAQKGAAEIDQSYTALKTVAEALAQALQAGTVSKGDLLPKINELLTQNPNLHGIAVAYLPNKYEASTRLFAPYVQRIAGTLQSLQIESVYDYTTSTRGQPWFGDAVQRGAGFIEPYYGEASKSMLAAYSIPFYEAGNKSNMLGIISVNYTLSDIGDIVTDLDLGKVGYASVLSKKGAYYYHPNNDWVTRGLTIDNIADTYQLPALKEAGKHIANGEPFYTESIGPVTGGDTYRYYQPIPSIGGSLETVVIKEETQMSHESVRKNGIWISLEAMLLLICGFALFTMANQGSAGALWKLVIFSSLMMTITIGVIWYLAIHYFTYKQDNLTTIQDKAELNQFKDRYAAQSADNLFDDTQFIPTGISLRSIKFEGANEVKVTGYVWQKYPEDFPEASRGIVFPEAVESTQEEAYETTKDGIVTKGWSFAATLRENYSYNKYPLDIQDTWIRMWPKDFYKNIVLTPDIEAYKVMDPRVHPGVPKDMVLSGLRIESSFFSYVNQSYDTNYGIAQYEGDDQFPELYFTVLSQRTIFDPLISYVLPLFLITVILFAVLMMITKEEKRHSLFEVTPSVVLATCSGLFFSVLVAHSAIRNSFAVNEVLYIENFAFILYFMILLVTVNSYLFSLKEDMKLVQYRDNLIPKLTFWPITLFILLLSTAILFY